MYYEELPNHAAANVEEGEEDDEEEGESDDANDQWCDGFAQNMWNQYQAYWQNNR